MKRFLTSALAICLVVLSMSSCKKKDNEPPVVPSVATIKADLSEFSNPVPESDTKATIYFNLVANMIQPFQVFMNNTLAVPTHAFELAIQHEPIEIDEDMWQWTSSYTEGANTYNSRLIGIESKDQVHWEMYISCDGPIGFNEYLWFSGHSAKDGKFGHWEFNLMPNSDYLVMTSDWTTLNGEEVNYAKFAFVANAPLNNGEVTAIQNSYIELTGGKLDPSYPQRVVIHHDFLSSWFDFIVEYNTSTHIGRVQCESYFGATNWFYWDATHANYNGN